MFGDHEFKKGLKKEDDSTDGSQKAYKELQ